MANVLTITDSQFASEVQDAEQTVLVYFWASWCGPCRLMSPLMDGLTKTYGDRLKVIKMEVDPNPETVAKYKVEGVPALFLFRNGELLESTEGAINRQKLESFINTHVPAA